MSTTVITTDLEGARIRTLHIVYGLHALGLCRTFLFVPAARVAHVRGAAEGTLPGRHDAGG